MPKTKASVANELNKKLVDALYEAQDLPSLYAPLTLLCESQSKAHISDELIETAKCACLYLMHKELVEAITMPRSFRGLALPTVTAENLSKTVFQNMGSKCCSGDITVQDLVKEGGLTEINANKLLPYLQQVGRKASSRVEALRTVTEESQ